MAAFNVPTERKYMIRVIGDCIGLRLLDTATYVWLKIQVEPFDFELFSNKREMKGISYTL